MIAEVDAGINDIKKEIVKNKTMRGDPRSYAKVIRTEPIISEFIHKNYQDCQIFKKKIAKIHKTLLFCEKIFALNSSGVF